MTAQALTARDRWSVVTVAADDAPSPWETLFAWPRFGDDHVSLGRLSSAPAKRRNIWAARLDEIVGMRGEPVLLVASGAGCLATAWWARLSPASYVSRVAGALFFAPSGDAAEQAEFLSPRARLPFPSLLVGPEDTIDEAVVHGMADDWGSRVMRRARRRPLRTAGEQAWHHAQRMVGSITTRIVDHDVDAVARLLATDAQGRPKRDLRR